MVVDATLLGPRSLSAAERFRCIANPSRPVSPLLFLGLHVVYPGHHFLRSDNPAQERSITRAPAKSLQPVAFDSHASRSTRPVTALRSSLSQRGVPRGALPSHPALQKFIDFDKTVSTFQGQLSDVLYGEEYARCVTELEDKDLKWLVDYLDEVCYRASPLPFPLNLA